MKTKEIKKYNRERVRCWRYKKKGQEPPELKRTLNKIPKPKKQINPFSKHKCCICKSQATGIISKKYFCNKCYNNNNYNKRKNKNE